MKNTKTGSYATKLFHYIHNSTINE
jgi:hypothetical protein